VLKFDGTDYEIWSKAMGFYLDGEGIVRDRWGHSRRGNSTKKSQITLGEVRRNSTKKSQTQSKKEEKHKKLIKI
jgi:hypothetical protein